jgi:hypothetical protein
MAWSENKMKKILAVLWLSLGMAACDSVSTASSTIIPAGSAAVTPTVTLQSQATIPIPSVIPYTSTPSSLCPSYGSDGPSVYLDEIPAFTIRQGPGCEFEAVQSIPVKKDALAFLDVLEQQGDWLLVDFCNDQQGWVFSPAIDDVNIHVDSENMPMSPDTQETSPTLPTIADSTSMEYAKNTLVSFFDHLSSRKYDEASQVFSGGYGMIIMWNPDVDKQDHPALLRTACEFNDFQCSLRVSRVTGKQQISPMEYHFIVEFIREDGSPYQRPDNSGVTVSEFLFRVVKDCNEKYFVVDWPFYGY